MLNNTLKIMSENQQRSAEIRRIAHDQRHGTTNFQIGRKVVNVVIKNPTAPVQDPNATEANRLSTLDSIATLSPGLDMAGALDQITVGTPSPSQYQVPPISGGQGPIYNFEAPPEQLTGDLATGAREKKAMLVYYFTHLYPMTSASKWAGMSLTELSNYYYNLDFWYTFNGSWGVTPMPITLDPRVISKWEKNTFYQAGTIVQSSITSLSWDLDSYGQKYYYAGRMNNASQVDPSITYKTKAGETKTIRTICRDKEFWESVLGTKVEITSWGWSPYPFGMYAQGPFKGTGNFLSIPKRSIIGTSHCDIIYQCKRSKISDETLWANILNHEISRAVPGVIYMGSVNCTPWVIKKRGNQYSWGNLFNNNTGYTPIMVSYSCFIIGGFGGIGDAWEGNYGSFWNSWQNGAGGSWGAGYFYAPVIEETTDSKGATVLKCPTDQSIPTNTGLRGFSQGRASGDMWKCFSFMFKDHISRWDTNYAVEMWRFPLFSSGGDSFLNTGPCVNNTCDDFMMAMATGNFNIVHYSPWGVSMLDPALSVFSNSPMKWSQVLNSDGSVGTSGTGFPTGKLTSVGSGYTFAVRTQMPNVNGDICQEFADFRVLVPGALATGSGDQNQWAKMFKYHCQEHMFTVDPFDNSNYHSFSGDYEPWIPETQLQTVQPDNNWWKHSENAATQKSFFDFDVYSGKWVGWLAYCGQRSGKNIAFEANPAQASSNGIILMLNTVLNESGQAITVSDECKLPDPLKNIQPKPLSGALQDLGRNVACYEGKDYQCQDWWNCRKFTFARTNDKYYPFATDAFTTGVIGFQANGWYANIGSCQTRWWINSKGISWKFDAPLANRLMMKNGLRLQGQSHALEACGMPLPLRIALFVLIAAVVFIAAYALYTKPQQYKLITLVCFIVILITTLGILFVPSQKDKTEETQLRIYFTLVYPMVPIKRWQNMPLWQLRKFYCSLHQWYRGEGLPSPLDYKDSYDWTGQPPFHLKSSWKNFTTRKNCVIGAPRALNPYDGNVVIGYDNKVGTTAGETPTGILFRKRQINACGKGANIQHVTFFSPSYNMWVDTFNHTTSVNDPGLEYWQKAEYVEVSTQWGPFPDGAYFDWAQGTGIFMKLGKHVVGYNGQDLIRRLGNELVASLPNLMEKFKTLYFDLWQRTGFNGMTVDQEGDISNPGICSICGMYGAIIMTMDQLIQLEKVQREGEVWIHTGDDFDTADGVLYERLAQFIKPSYYDAQKKKWVSVMPTGQGHVKNYPFPMPFNTGKFIGDGQGRPVMNDFSLKMPWKYQQFNISSFYRQMTINALFLDSTAIPYAELVNKGADYNYVDILKANQSHSLPTPKTWGEATNIIDNLLGQPVAHPFFSVYPRLLGWDNDGPMLIISNSDEWKSGRPSLSRVQTGALDKKVYPQDITSFNGVSLRSPMDLPQLDGADLEVDHWTSGLARILGYDTAARIQHWCGNKSLAYDLEVINFRITVPGNLTTNVLYGNIYEIWKAAFASGWFTLRDPFYHTNNVYTDTYKDIYDGNDITSASQNATWLPAPWIGYDEKNNLYGWEPESLTNWANIQRLSYEPMSAEQIGFSSSYPEYNKYIMHHFTKLLA